MKFIVGAYATAPSLGANNITDERIYYEQMIKSIPDIRGLEIPFWGEDINSFGSDFLLEIIPHYWDNVLTCIPGTMKSLAISARIGLASDNEQGRNESIAMHKRANQMVHKMNARFGRQSIFAVQVTSAPSTPVANVSSSMDSFLYSMNELLSWDWGGAKLIIEHCDASITGQSFEKGFFSFAREIEAIEKLTLNHNLGIMINWGRSAIEGRSPNKPVEHIKLASKHNMLSGLIFSGVSDSDEQYGSWKDTHMPFAKYSDAKYYEEKSFLTEYHISNTLNALDFDKLDYLGIKLLSMPVQNSTIERRVGLNRDAISTLNQLIA